MQTTSSRKLRQDVGPFDRGGRRGRGVASCIRLQWITELGFVLCPPTTWKQVAAPRPGDDHPITMTGPCRDCTTPSSRILLHNKILKSPSPRCVSFSSGKRVPSRCKHPPTLTTQYLHRRVCNIVVPHQTVVARLCIFYLSPSGRLARVCRKRYCMYLRAVVLILLPLHYACRHAAPRPGTQCPQI